MIMNSKNHGLSTRFGQNKYNFLGHFSGGFFVPCAGTGIFFFALGPPWPDKGLAPLVANSDYLVDAVLKRLRFPALYPSTPLVLARALAQPSSGQSTAWLVFSLLRDAFLRFFFVFFGDFCHYFSFSIHAVLFFAEEMKFGMFCFFNQIFFEKLIIVKIVVVFSHANHIFRPFV